MRSLVLALLLAAGAASAQAPRRPAPYLALGTEPFWSLAIDGSRITYTDPEERRITVATPRPRPIANGRRYATRRIVVEITREECSDGMSDFVYADTVVAVVDGRRLEGCGGPRTNAAPFDGTWRIVAIGGALVSGEEYALTFSEGRLTGRAGCNRLNGSYRVEPRGFVAGPIAATRMACPGARMRHEAAVLRILALPARVAETGNREMVLANAAGAIRLRLVSTP